MRKKYLKALPRDWRPAAGIFSALGDETRQKILLTFEPEDELPIMQIVQLFPMGRSTIAHHLGVLEKAGILTVRREGRLALYKLCYAPVLDALERLRQLIDDDLKTADAKPKPMQKLPTQPKARAKTLPKRMPKKPRRQLKHSKK